MCALIELVFKRLILIIGIALGRDPKCSLLVRKLLPPDVNRDASRLRSGCMQRSPKGQDTQSNHEWRVAGEIET